MQEQVAVPITVQFIPQRKQFQPRQKQNEIKISKYKSQPKFRTYKEQILKIPKVKQILNKDKFVYSQDIEKRLQLIGTLKSQKYTEQQICDLHGLRKDVDKKNKRHKTNFKIPLSRKNMESLNSLIVKHISHNQIFKNQEAVFLKQYTENAPFDLQQLKFMDKLDKVKSRFSEKYPDLNPRVLSKNKLTLQNVILNRNIKREMKLDDRKKQKEHCKNVMSTIQTDFGSKLLAKMSEAKKMQK